MDRGGVVRISIDHETESCRDVPAERLYYGLCPNLNNYSYISKNMK